MPFLARFQLIGTTINSAAFDSVVNGVIILFDNVAMGHNPASTINAKASAPPKRPSLHSTKAIGTIISEYKSVTMFSWSNASTDIITVIAPNANQ